LIVVVIVVVVAIVVVIFVVVVLGEKKEKNEIGTRSARTVIYTVLHSVQNMQRTLYHGTGT
jgi:flagellar basal body-associated protein FliL